MSGRLRYTDEFKREAAASTGSSAREYEHRSKNIAVILMS
jgi:hypothetical protein